MSLNKLKKNNVKITVGSVANKRVFKNNISDISISCGVLPIFDDYKSFLEKWSQLTTVQKKKCKIFFGCKQFNVNKEHN